MKVSYEREASLKKMYQRESEMNKNELTPEERKEMKAAHGKVSGQVQAGLAVGFVLSFVSVGGASWYLQLGDMITYPLLAAFLIGDFIAWKLVIKHHKKMKALVCVEDRGSQWHIEVEPLMEGTLGGAEKWSIEKKQLKVIKSDMGHWMIKHQGEFAQVHQKFKKVLGVQD